MKERPIIFSGDMVRAILDGRKTMTRRVIKPQPQDWTYDVNNRDWPAIEVKGLCDRVKCPYGQAGDLLWVREAWQVMVEAPRLSDIIYRADKEELPHAWMRWNIPIHMPRWMSRLTLQINDVKVDRLQSISEEDAKAEGVSHDKLVVLKDGSPCYSMAFRRLWTSIHGIDNPKSWEANPWVWVISFEVVK